MAKVLETIGVAAKPPLWLDDAAYVDKLLAGGKTPWLASAEYVALRRKAVGLLKPDFNVLPLGQLMRAWVEAHAALRDAMAAKKRAVVPARTLLAEEGLRAHLVDTIQGLRAAFPAMPLILELPSPRDFVGLAHGWAFGADGELEVGEDEADSCAVYMAEFLRSFGEAGVDGLVLVEAAGSAPASVEELEWYQPVINVAQHYRWDLGLRLPPGHELTGEADGFGFVIADQSLGAIPRGQWIDDAYWTGDTAAPAVEGQFVFAHIPAEAVPETVLERLNALR